MTSHYGNDNTPSTGFFFDDRGDNQMGTTFGSSFPGGYVTKIWWYGAGDGGSATVRYVIWGTGGSIIWNSATHSIAGGSRSSGGQAWQSNGVTGGAGQPGLQLNPGTNVRLGIWTSGNVVWTFESSGSVAYDAGHTDVASFSADGTDGSGDFGVYLEYIPVSAPTLTSATPNVGAAGDTIALVGTQFTYATAVTIGGASASFTVVDDSHITATVPAGATPGVGTVVVTNDFGSASLPFTVGQIFYGDPSGNGTTHTIAAIWYGDPSGNGVPHKVAGVWVPSGGGGVKRVW